MFAFIQNSACFLGALAANREQRHQYNRYQQSDCLHGDKDNFHSIADFRVGIHAGNITRELQHVSSSNADKGARALITKSHHRAINTFLTQACVTLVLITHIAE